MKSLGRTALILCVCFGSLTIAAAEEDRGETKEQKALKNRAAVPKASDIDPAATIAALLQKTGETDWSDKKAGRLEGVVMQVEREEDGDLHLVLAASEGDTDSKKWVIVEITPTWLKKMKLNAKKLKEYMGKRVAATGWLYYEPDTTSVDPRGTRWELHPVTSIELMK